MQKNLAAFFGVLPPPKRPKLPSTGPRGGGFPKLGGAFPIVFVKDTSWFSKIEGRPSILENHVMQFIRNICGSGIEEDHQSTVR